MARIRSIKPEITESETLASLPLAVCWTFACLWPHCDDRGRRKAQPRLVLADLYPMRDDIEAEDVEEHLTLLDEAGVICRYIGCDGKPYLHVVNWDEHQKVDRPSKSRIPPCRVHEADEKCAKHPEGCESSHPDLTEYSANPRETVASPPEDASNGSRTLDLGPRTVDLGPGTIAPAKPSRGTREPDVVWDTLLEACSVDATGITESSRGAYNRAVADLKRVGATPQDIHRRAGNFRAKWPDVSLTPTALSRRWAECDTGPPMRGVTPDRNSSILSGARARALEAEAQEPRKAIS